MQRRCWRKHSKDFPRGTTPPQTLEALQAAWDRDQELLYKQQGEIQQLKLKLNQANQRFSSKFTKGN